MLEYFKNIADKNSCSTGAVCSIHPSVNSLYQIILIEISEICFYIVKLKNFGFENKNIYEFLVEGLSIFLINTSFNQKKYLSLILKLDEIRKNTKEKYLDYCKENNLPYEIIDKNIKIDTSTTITELISYSDNYTLTRQKNINTQSQRLFELVILMAKLASINIIKIKKLNYDNSFDYKVLKFFSLVNDYSIKKEKIKKRILEFSSLILEIKSKLYSLQKEKFGQKETSKINLSIENGYNILVSGDDFDELDKVLKEIENYNDNEEINVYTNGALFLANFYPYFKNNKFLKGHWGGDNAEFDFSNFTGSILITQNFVQKIDSLYRGEIFSKKIISFSKVTDIINDDYKPLIDSCLKFNKTTKNEQKEILIEYEKNKLKNIADNEFVLVIGRLNKKIKKDKINNKNIIFLNPALEGELLLEEINNIKGNNLKLKIFFSECSLCNLDLLFTILNFEFEIYFVSCSNILINPHVTEALKQDFNVKMI